MSRLVVFETFQRLLMVVGSRLAAVMPWRQMQKPDTDKRELLAAIIDSTEDAVIALTLDGVITSWNPSAERLLGYSVTEIIGRHISMIIPADRRGEETRILEKIRNGERLQHYETVRMCKNGNRLDFNLAVSPIRNQAGEIVGASKVARNITERKRAEAALRDAQVKLERANQELEATVEKRTVELREAITELQAFSYSVSHDLRAPLRSMQGYAQMLQEDYGTLLPPEARHYLERISTNSARLNQLIQHVLAYSRISRGELTSENVSLEKVLREAVEHSPALQAAAADLHILTPLPEVVGHQASLMQCLLNLLSNASKFVAPGTRPRIRVWAEKAGEQVRLWVADNGIGIEAKEQERIFGLFERLYPDSVYEGSGLGLPIVRRAVERMGGQVGLVSAPGQGSRFWIQLPAAPVATEILKPKFRPQFATPPDLTNTALSPQASMA